MSAFHQYEGHEVVQHAHSTHSYRPVDKEVRCSQGGEVCMVYQYEGHDVGQHALSTQSHRPAWPRRQRG